MELTFVAKNTTLTEAIKRYAEKRFAKLDRRFREPVPVQLEIRKEGARDEDERFVAEVTIRLKGGLIRSEDCGASPYAAIDVVESTLDRRILHYKERFTRRRRQATRFEEAMFTQMAAAPAIESLAEPVETLGDGRIVRTKTHVVTPMSVEEAAAQMELLGHNFYVFQNKETKAVNVVYRRQDDDYGLIVPEVEK